MKLHYLEDRLTHQSVVLLALAVVYGTAAGAFVTMYYEAIPSMDAIEDRLAGPLGILYVLAAGSGLIHLPRAVRYLFTKRWKKAMVRAGLGLGPLFVFLGADGLIAHFLWWGPLSDTDRYHILHHTLIAGAPLTLIFGLAVRRWWIPAEEPDEPIGVPVLAFSAAVGIIFFLGIGLLFGSPVVGFVLIGGLLASVLYARFVKEKVRS